MTSKFPKHAGLQLKHLRQLSFLIFNILVLYVPIHLHLQIHTKNTFPDNKMPFASVSLPEEGEKRGNCSPL